MTLGQPIQLGKYVNLNITENRSKYAFEVEKVKKLTWMAKISIKWMGYVTDQSSISIEFKKNSKNISKFIKIFFFSRRIIGKIEASPIQSNSFTIIIDPSKCFRIQTASLTDKFAEKMIICEIWNYSKVKYCKFILNMFKTAGFKI